MAAEVRCTNPSCGRPSRLGADALGRTFRCVRCGTKLPRATGCDRGGAAGLLPWEEEGAAEGAGRSLGMAMPARLGRFQVRGVLGSGTHATVYRAFDPDLEREVALKVPQPGCAGESKAMARFLAEARALARLRHPGIVPVFESGRWGEVPFLATAFLDGRTLAQVLEGGPLDFARAAEIAAELAEALAYAHGLGVVHRDVKPANVMVETSGAVQLTDFGLAHRNDSAGLTRKGVLVGTPAYVSPEQASCAEELARPEGDQYSLGVVLYEMLCGRPPFLGPPTLVLYSTRFDDPLSPRRLRPGVPRSLERICLRAMARQASDRYPDCLALAAALRTWLARSASARRSRVKQRLRKHSLDRAVGWVRRRPSAALSTVLAFLGLAASTVLATALVAPLAPAHAPPDGAPPGPSVADNGFPPEV